MKKNIKIVLMSLFAALLTICFNDLLYPYDFVIIVLLGGVCGFYSSEIVMERFFNKNDH